MDVTARSGKVTAVQETGGHNPGLLPISTKLGIPFTQVTQGVVVGAKLFRGTTEFRKFRGIVRSLLAVPKAELDRMAEAAKKQSPRVGESECSWSGTRGSWYMMFKPQ